MYVKAGPETLTFETVLKCVVSFYSHSEVLQRNQDDSRVSCTLESSKSRKLPPDLDKLQSLE